MSSMSLFGYLKNYVPSDGRDPKEDYLTQMFAWILSNVDGAATVYATDLFSRLNMSVNDIENKKIQISTQETLRTDEGIGRIDLLLSIGEDIAFICEHKVFSELSENQIDKYVKNAGQLGNRTYYSVLVTYSIAQWTQYSDVALTWSDVYTLFENKITQRG